MSGYLNPANIELEPIAHANYLNASVTADERRQSEAILHVSANGIEIIAFRPSRFHTVKLEISDFEQIRLAEIEGVDDHSGEFWEEVGGRVANTLKQAMMFLKEKTGFSSVLAH